MKKICYILLCALAQVAQAHNPYTSFTGVYLKAGVGATLGDYTVSPEYVFSDPNIFTFNFAGDYDLDASSPAGLIGLSYLYQFSNHMLVGIEATAGYAKAQAGYDAFFDEVLPDASTGEIQFSSHTNIEITNDFALLFKPGYVSGHNTLFYGLVGPRWAHIKSTVKSGMLLHFPPTTLTAQDAESESGYQLGYTVGGGIQQRITEQFHISLEYAYTNYGNINVPELISTVLANGTPTTDVVTNAPDILAHTNSLMFEILYQW